MSGSILLKPVWHAASRQLKVGGLTRFSSCDYPGQLAAVVFVAGCPWRCGYCHNPHLQARPAGAGVAGGAGAAGSTGGKEDVGGERATVPSFARILEWLKQRGGLLDAVVFSGGEACIDPALPAALQAVRALGFKTGLHTAGMYPARLQQVLSLLDWVGLDIKAPLADRAAIRATGHDAESATEPATQPGVDAAAAYVRITGVARSVYPVRQSLAQVLASGVAYECRTTIHPALLSSAELLALAQDLAGQGVRHYALQAFRAQGCADAGLRDCPAGGVIGDYPGQLLLRQVGALFSHFAWRA